MSEKEKIEIYILNQSVIQHYVLPPHCEGSYLLRLDPDDKDAVLKIYAKEKHWWCSESQYLHIKGSSVENGILIQPQQYLEIKGKKANYLLLTSTYCVDTHKFYSYVPKTKEITIGRSDACDIIYTHQAISFHHARIRKSEKGWQLIDEGSVNGCFVNGKRRTTASLKRKDCVQILELVILIDEQYLYINHPQNCLITSSIPIVNVHVDAIVKAKPSQLQIQVPFIEGFIPQCYEVDMPPLLSLLDETPLIFMLGPSLTMGVSSLSMGVFSLFQVRINQQSLLQSIPTLIMSFSMALGAIVWPCLTRRYHRKKQERDRKIQQEAYEAYLHSVEQDIMKEVSAYEQYLQTIHGTCITCLKAIEKGQLIRYAYGHPAFQWLTFGYGALPYFVQYQKETQGFHMHQELCEKRSQLLHKTYQMHHVPIALKLSEYTTIEITGEDRKYYLCHLLMQLALTHSPDDVRIYVCMEEKEAYETGIVWLPHIYPSKGRQRMLFSTKRELRLLEHKKDDKEYLSVLFDFEDSDSVSYRDDQAERIIHFCCRKKENLHPSIHKAIVHVSSQEGKLLIKNKQYAFQYELLQKEDLRFCAKRLFQTNNPKILQPSSHAVQFLDMYQCGSVEELNIWERWSHANTSKSLCVQLGINANEEPLCLDFHERAHGPHGLIAGMTGSGKSECLLTLILSLCICYSPLQVSLLLIDYKGGTMASLLQRLPHVAGIITNLETQQMQRAFLSLQSELLRRQRLMKETSLRYGIGNMDIDQYDELCRTYSDLKPLSHLFLIADEFAELKVQQSVFMNQLKQMARIGRSLGIHLVLATQKPAGVIDDQIWSNAHFHLCMKVQSVQDSRDMLKKEDAVYLKKAGECCFQVGCDEVYEKGIIAWSRCPYHKKEVYEKAYSDEVAILTFHGEDQAKCRIKEQQASSVTQMEAIVKEICSCAKQHQMHASSLWKEPLAVRCHVSEYPQALLLVDDIKKQRQYPLYVKDYSFTHTFLFGQADESRNMYLTTFLYTYIRYARSDVLIYILDFVQHDLKIFAHHKGVIEVMEESEEDKILIFFDWLTQEMKQRKKRKSSQHCLFILHGYEQFHERFAAYETLLQHIMQEGMHVNIYLFLSTSSIDSIPYRLMLYPHENIVFQLQEQNDVQRLFKENDIQPSQALGSGVFLHQGDVCLFQTLYTEEHDIAKLQPWSGWEYDYQIPTMPLHITHRMFDHALYLGKQKDNIRDVFLSLKSCSLVYICAAYRLYLPTLTLWIQQMKYQQNICIVNEHNLFFQQKVYSLTAFDQIYKQAEIFVWQRCYACIDENIQQYLMNRFFQDQKHHVMLFTMCEQMEYNRYEWFKMGFYEAEILWVGKGFLEYRHVFKNTSLPNKDVKKNEAYLIKEEVCTALQLWEEEASE